MRKKLLFILLALPLLSLQGQTAEEIITKADAPFKNESMYSVSETQITKNGRLMPIQGVESYTLNKDGISMSLSVYKTPKKMKGTAHLMIGDDLWVRFASTGRIRKLSSSAKKNSAGGSDFSYVDMGDGGNGIADNYSVRLVGEEEIREKNCWKLELLPMPHNDSGYEKLNVYVHKEDYSYIQVDYFEDGANIKTMYLQDYRLVKDILYPYSVIMENHTRDSQTEIVTLELELNSPRVTESLFTQNYLKRIR